MIDTVPPKPEIVQLQFSTFQLSTFNFQFLTPGPTSNQKQTQDALERQYGELCSQINAYHDMVHVAGSSTTVRTPIFDTGSTDHLISAEGDPYMTKTSRSPLPIGGFSGPDRVSAWQHGTISAFMVSDHPRITGSMVEMKVHSVSAGNINADLISSFVLSMTRRCARHRRRVKQYASVCGGYKRCSR